MVFGLFEPKKPAGAAASKAAAPAAPWPWPNTPETQIRALLKARIRYLTNQKYIVESETPDFSSAMVEMGATFNQRQKLRELWREEVHLFNNDNQKK